MSVEALAEVGPRRAHGAAFLAVKGLTALPPSRLFVAITPKSENLRGRENLPPEKSP
jgi:hypothetical protein